MEKHCSRLEGWNFQHLKFDLKWLDGAVALQVQRESNNLATDDRNCHRVLSGSTVSAKPVTSSATTVVIRDARRRFALSYKWNEPILQP